jgi:putative restriction endonuclease
LTGWVASLSVAEADNWEICKRDSWFGSPNTVAKNVKVGDELFMWRSKAGLFAYCVVTGNAEPAATSYVPWPNPDKYKYVWPIDVVEELPEPLPTAWTALDALAGIGGKPASQLPQIPEDRTAAVRALFRGPADRLVRIEAFDLVRRELRQIDSEHDARVRTLRAIVTRRGQGHFRAQLLEAYGGRCCMTGYDVEPVLEAAHIAPYMGAHTNRVDNGLLLRADVHTLFDLDRLTVLPGGTIRVDPALASSPYGDLDGQPLTPPADPGQRPATSVLQQHNRRCDWLG